MDVTNELEEWLSQRNLWVQNAINRIITIPQVPPRVEY